MKRHNRKRDKTAENERLSLLAREFGAAILVVLVNDYGLSQDGANMALTKILAQMKTTRQMITTTMAMADHEIANQSEEK